MSKVLSGRIRKVGNSLAVIIPKGLLDEAGAKEGDMVRLSLAIPISRRDSALEAIAGLDRGKRAFRREKLDRY
jgi:antitoxin component of MazEF toxin-antitoxin module